jgi:DNA polymerase III alpha subunit
MIEAADTRCLTQVESPGFQALLRRVREASREAQTPVAGPSIDSLEDLAQLLALWRPGAFSKTEEQSYLAVRFGGQRPTYFHPAPGAVLDATHGALLYADQVAALLRGLGFTYEWADRFRRALATGQRARRIDMEHESMEQASQPLSGCCWA